MHYKQNGTSLWYGTPDAPAPEGDLPASPTGRASGITLTFAVQPIGARNAVELRYRVNGGGSVRLSASLAHTDIRASAQYFTAHLPEFRVGDTVEYVGVASWPGGQVPTADVASTFPSSFHVVAAGQPNQTAKSASTSNHKPSAHGFHPTPAPASAAHASPASAPG